jgi:hypothetical protein
VTATVTKPADPLVVLRRAEQKHTGEEPGDLNHLADAVRVHIVEPLLAGATGPVDDAQVKQLQFDKQRLDDLVTELRKHVTARDKTIDRQVQQVTDLKHQLDEARAERDTATAQLREQGPAPDGALAQAQADNARLADELACARRDLRWANKALDEIADDEASRPAIVHVHQHLTAGPGEFPENCACGHPWPRNPTDDEPEEVVPDVEPWGDLFGQIRSELGGWSA